MSEKCIEIRSRRELEQCPLLSKVIRVGLDRGLEFEVWIGRTDGLPNHMLLGMKPGDERIYGTVVGKVNYVIHFAERNFEPGDEHYDALLKIYNEVASR